MRCPVRTDRRRRHEGEGSARVADERAITVEAPRTPDLYDLEARLVMTIEELVPDPSGGSLYVSSSASDPYHWTFTTVTRPSGVTPRILADCRMSSSAAKFVPLKSIWSMPEQVSEGCGGVLE